MELGNYNYILGNLQNNFQDEEVVKLELEQIYRNIYQNRKLVEPYAKKM